MLTKNIVGAIIILLNMAGLGFLFFIGISKLLEGKDTDDFSDFGDVSRTGPRAGRAIDMNEEIIPDEEDLLKDMDLSDLDSLDLEDLE